MVSKVVLHVIASRQQFQVTKKNEETRWFRIDQATIKRLKERSLIPCKMSYSTPIIVKPTLLGINLCTF